MPHQSQKNPAEAGLHVAQPLGDNLPYDLLVDSGKKILRIQIKTSTTKDRYGNNNSRSRYSFILKRGAKSEVYTAGSIDFFALVVLPLHTIYIVPYEIIGGRAKMHRLSRQSGFNWTARTDQ